MKQLERILPVFLLSSACYAQDVPDQGRIDPRLYGDVPAEPVISHLPTVTVDGSLATPRPLDLSLPTSAAPPRQNVLVPPRPAKSPLADAFKRTIPSDGFSVSLVPDAPLNMPTQIGMTSAKSLATQTRTQLRAMPANIAQPNARILDAQRSQSPMKNPSGGSMADAASADRVRAAGALAIGSLFTGTDLRTQLSNGPGAEQRSSGGLRLTTGGIRLSYKLSFY